jgi:hypothetical protein
MFAVTINDEFCEWTYQLGYDDSLSIQDLIDAITNNTNLHEISHFISNDFDNKTHKQELK